MVPRMYIRFKCKIDFFFQRVSSDSTTIRIGFDALQNGKVGGRVAEGIAKRAKLPNPIWMECPAMTRLRTLKCRSTKHR